MLSITDRTERWILRDGDRELFNGTEWSKLEKAILQIQDTANWPNEICDLESPSGKVLSIGIAKSGTKENPEIPSDLACVNFQSETGDPPYLSVVGDQSLDYETGGVVIFRYGNGHWTEILRRNCVTIEVMHRIAKEFVETKKLAEWIAWEDA